MHFTDLDVERFWSKVDKSAGADGCWPWMGGRDAMNYGRFYVRGINIPATRTSLVIAGFPRPEGNLLACHKCDNPPCVNPQHLWWGTHLENIRDCVGKGRFKGAVARKLGGVCRRGHLLSEDNIYYIKGRPETDVPVIICKTCHYNSPSKARQRRLASHRRPKSNTCARFFDADLDFKN